MPSATWRAEIVEGRAGRERPRCRRAAVTPAPASGGRSRPALPLSNEARCRARLSGEFDGPIERSSTSDPAQILTAITSGIVRARRVAVQGSSLRYDRARCARLARVRLPCKPQVLSVRETLTASRASAAFWQLRDGRKTRHICRITRWRCAAVANFQRIGVPYVQAPGAGDWLPLWTTRSRMSGRTATILPEDTRQ